MTETYHIARIAAPDWDMIAVLPVERRPGCVAGDHAQAPALL